MKIVVIGAGAIGGLVAGYLKLQQQEVSLIGHAESISAIKDCGLQISGVRGDFNIKLEAAEGLNCDPELAILATKTQDITSVLESGRKFLQKTILLTTQNGVRADDLAAQYVPEANLVSSIVMFGSTCLEPGKVVHNFEGNWIIGRIFGKNDRVVAKVSGILNKIFPTAISEEIKGMKYLKVFVNANNCIPAILGLSMQEAFSDVEVSKISIAIWKEGLRVANIAGIKLVSLPDFPLERVAKLASLPIAEAAKIYSGITSNLSKEPLYGSILQSIKRSKPSEIDFINGEFVALAEENNITALLNTKLVEMVHQVEESKKFFSKEELILRIREYVV